MKKKNLRKKNKNPQKKIQMELYSGEQHEKLDGYEARTVRSHTEFVRKKRTATYVQRSELRNRLTPYLFFTGLFVPLSGIAQRQIKQRILPIVGILAIIVSLIFLGNSTLQSFPKSHPTKLFRTLRPDNSVHLSLSDYRNIVDSLKVMIQKSDPTAALTWLKNNATTGQAILNSCHTIAHAIGRASYDKYKDFTTAMQYQDDFCGSGYIHGVIEAKFKSSLNIYADMNDTCPPTNAGSCYHGIGHGLMYFTNNDLPRSIALCDTYTDYEKKERCAEGVYMENFTTDISVHPSKFLRPDDPFFPCNEQTGMYKSVCYFYAPVYYLSLHGNKYAATIDWCKTAEAGYIGECIDGAGSRIMKQNISDPLTVEKICEGAGQFTSNCIDGMVGYYVINFSSWEKGEDLCDRLDDSNKPTCLAAVNSRKSFFLN